MKVEMTLLPLCQPCATYILANKDSMVYNLYGTGARCTFSTPNLIKDLNLKVGKLSTGDSLDMSPHDEAAILENEATIKDMEGAAVAYVADMFSVPSTAEEFLQNLVAVIAALD